MTFENLYPYFEGKATNPDLITPNKITLDCPICGGINKLTFSKNTLNNDFSALINCFYCQNSPKYKVQGGNKLFKNEVLPHFGLVWQDFMKIYEEKFDDVKPLYKSSHQYFYQNSDVPTHLLEIHKYQNEKIMYWYTLVDGKPVPSLKGLKASDLPLYNSPVLEKLHAGDTVYIVEGQKDADTLYKNFGLPSTTLPTGAGSKYYPSYNFLLYNKNIIILTDNDEPGEIYGNTVYSGVIESCQSVKLIRCTVFSDKLGYTLNKGDDITDVYNWFKKNRKDLNFKKFFLDTLAEIPPNVTTPPEFFENNEYSFDSYSVLDDVIIEPVTPDTPSTPKVENKIEKNKNSGAESPNNFKLISHHVNAVEVFLEIIEKFEIINLYGKIHYYDKNNGIYKPFIVEDYLGTQYDKRFLKNRNFGDLKLSLRVNAAGRLKSKVFFEDRICIDKGILDLNTGEISKFNKNYVFTYNFGAVGDAQVVETYLAATVDNIPKIGFFLGSCLLGNNKLGKCLFLLGPPKTGKTEMCEMFCSIFEKNSTVFMGVPRLAPFDKFDLVGSYINYNDDIRFINIDTHELQTLITSKMPVQIQRKNLESMYGKLTAGYLFSTNCNPTFHASCEGMLRRTWVVSTKECQNRPPIPTRADWLAFSVKYATILCNKWAEAEIKRKDYIDIDVGEESEVSDPVSEFLKGISFPILATNLYPQFKDFYEKNYFGYELLSLRDFNNYMFSFGYIRKTVKIDKVSYMMWTTS